MKPKLNALEYILEVEKVKNDITQFKGKMFENLLESIFWQNSRNDGRIHDGEEELSPVGMGKQLQSSI